MVAMIRQNMVRKPRLVDQFGRYIAAEASHQRRDPGTRVKTSDELLTESSRRRVMEGARDLQRNYSVAAFAIRKHLDYVATFTFQSVTENEEFNQQWESLIAWWSRPLNFDVAARHSLRRFIRLMEARRVIDGDIFAVKMLNGRLQAIEADRVINPADYLKDATWVHGVRVGPGGKLLGIAVHKRDKSGRYVFEKEVKAGNVVQLGYFDAFDQVRGVSPLTSAISQFQDVLEVSDYARMKAKVTQLFALAITREMSDLDEEELEGASNGSYEVSLDRGPIKMEMDTGDKAEFLESRHPSTEFQDFMDSTIKAALKALDIPYSFFDESFTNYFGSRQALIAYLTSCKHKREDLIEMLDRLTVWRTAMWIANGVLVLPAGMTLSDLRWDWIPQGVPWWSPKEEIAGDIAAVDAKLRTRSEIRRERFGDDWRDVVRRLKAEDDFLAEMGMSSALPTNAATPVDAEEGEGESTSDDTAEVEGEGEASEYASQSGEARSEVPRRRGGDRSRR